MGSDAGTGWQGDVPPPTEPPPTPFERGPAPATAPAPPRAPEPTPPARRARRRRRALVAVAVAVVLVVAGALVLSGRTGGDADAGGGPAGAAAVDAALLALLGQVDASELTMLAFDEAAGAAFEGAETEDEALALVGAAAAAAVAELGERREVLAGPLDVTPAEEVRVAYLPHLDAWVAYLAAVAAEPDILFGADTEPLILRINATAEVFVTALEGAVATGVGPEVAEAARDIIQRGFPDQEDADL